MDLEFTIDGTQYSVPEVITTEMFSAASVWDITEVKNLKPFVSVLTGCPIHQLNLLDKEVFEILLAGCAMKLDLTNEEVTKIIMAKHLKDFDTFTFGEFMDIDVFTSDGPAKHVVSIVSKLYDIPEERAAKLDINKVWPAVMALLKWKKLVYAEHSEFFEQDGPKEEDIEVEFTINDLQLMWYNATLVLAQHEFLNINKVVERPYKEALNFLTWKKNEIAQQQLQQLKRKHDLQKRTR